MDMFDEINRNRSKWQNFKKFSLDNFGAIALVFLGLTIFYGIIALISLPFIIVDRNMGSIVNFISDNRLILFNLCIVTSIVLYVLRQKKPIIYGLLEIIGGLITLYYSIMLMTSTLREAMPVLAGIYIIIRGLDNISKGFNNNASSHTRMDVYRDRR